MDITLTNFQLKAIADLTEAMDKPNREIVLKSCTGSGKTIILTHFMDEYFKSNAKTVFVWLTPGKGNLEEQSKGKMDKYIHGSNTKLLCDIMTSGFEENDACFINWEKLTKKGNAALKDSERTNFLEHIQKAFDNGLSFKIIVDESHQNDTIKADDIIELFNSDKIIRCSATPKSYKDAILIEIPEADVIAEGLIKKLLIINENFEQNISVDDQITYLIDKAIAKQQELHSAFLNLKDRTVDINPLIIVQLPNKSDVLLESVENYFESKGITYENNLLAVWLSDKKQNLEDIEEPDAQPIEIARTVKDFVIADVELRHEVRNVKKYVSEYRFLQAEKLNTMTDIKNYIDTTKAEINKFERSRALTDNKRRRAKTPEGKQQYKDERKAITERITPLRKKLKQAVQIYNKSPRLIDLLDKEYQIERKTYERTK